LVVVGGRHHGALARGLGGSTAHTLVRTLGIPVLVVGPGGPAVARVLAAVDLSEATAPTFAAAAQYARLLDAGLRVVHVVEPIKFPVVVPLTIDASEFERRSTMAFEDLLRDVDDTGTVDRVVRRGTAVEVIATEVADWGAGLVVVGSHGKTWVDRMLIGSTTERLLNLLPASLLVVPIEAGRPRAGRRAPTRSRRGHPRTRKGARP
jgi:nucleotide-binding universal stress UspA family protein